MSKINTTRRGILRAGAGLAAFGGMGQMVSFSIAAEGSPAPIEIVTSNSNLTNTLLGIAKEKRFLEDLGLKPDITNVADGSKAIPSIISGDIDFCTLSGIGLVFPAIAKGGTLKMIGGASILLQTAIYSAKPDVKTMKDLEGRIVGTGALGALVHQVTVAVLIDNFISATVEMEADKAAAEAAVLKRKEQVPASARRAVPGPPCQPRISA